MGANTSNGPGLAVCGLPCTGARERRVRVLVTGASGMLGRQVMRRLEADDGTWEVRGLYSSRPGGNLVQCDLTDSSHIDQQFVEFAPDVVIHSAAERRPNVVFKQPELAHALNVDVTRNLAEACQKHNAMILFMSTDYIFDGENPPYAVDAEPRPLSTYGEQKVAGERICVEKCRSSVVLRVPLMYGPIEYAKESGVTAMYDELQRGIDKADNLQWRYPTYTCDVAKILAKMLQVHFDGVQPLRGIYHWQASEALTKYDMVRAIAAIADMDASAIKASLAPPKFPVPPDSRLDCSRLERELAIDAQAYRTPFRDALGVCMKDFFKRQALLQDGEGNGGMSMAGQKSVPRDEVVRIFKRMGTNDDVTTSLVEGAKSNLDGSIEAKDVRELIESQMRE